MSKTKARAHFLGYQGYEKFNCAQTIVHAFKDKILFPEEMVAQFEKYGGGRAPEGYCGAFYAAKVILEKYPDKLKECERSLVLRAGSTKCTDIRSSGMLTCLGCVDLIAECIEQF